MIRFPSLERRINVLNKLKLIGAGLLLAASGMAQTITVMPSNITVPAGTVLSISAMLDDTSANKLVTWTKSGGTFYGNATCTDAISAPCTIGFSGTAGNTYTITATSQANGASTATATVTVSAAPTTLTTHPRLFFTSSDIATLQGWASSSNEKWNALNNLAISQAYLLDAGFYAKSATNAQTGTSYTVVTGDCTRLVTLNNASAVAVSIPAASTTGFTTCHLWFKNLGAGTVTITAQAGSIGGLTSITLASGHEVYVASDGTNWQIARDVGSGGGGGYIACNGGTGVPDPDYVTNEELGWSGGNQLPRMGGTFALESLIDPITANRSLWQCRAHDLYMFTMSEIQKPDGTCTYGLCTAINLMGNYGGDIENSLVVPYDWIFSSFSSGERATIVSAWHTAATKIRTNEITGLAGAIGVTSASPMPMGVRNNPSIVADSSYTCCTSVAYGQIRTSGNNYYSLHEEQLALMGMAVDAADDASISSCAGDWTVTCTNGTANSIRAYALDFVGAYLYKQVLNFEDPYIATSYLNTAYSSSLSPTQQCQTSIYQPAGSYTNCFGPGRGGLSHEGSPLYMGALSRLVDTCVAMKTAGYLNPQSFMGVFGAPQLSFCYSSWWDLDTYGIMHAQAPALHGSVQTFFAWGEVNSVDDSIGFISNQFGSLTRFDQLIGRTDRTTQTTWDYGRDLSGQSYTFNVNQFPMLAPLHYMWAPTGTGIVGQLTTSDPRASMPPSFFSLNSGVFLSGSSWSASTGGIMNIMCETYGQIDHEDNYCGRLGFYWHGDWVTSPLNGYGLNTFTLAYERPQYENMVAISHDATATQNPYPLSDYSWKQGGTIRVGMAAGQTPQPPLWSTTNNYAFFRGDSTNSRKYYYSSTDARADMLGAVRDCFYDKNHFLYCYDRADTTAAGYKVSYFNSTGSPTITGREVMWTSSLGTVDAGLHILLPASAAAYNQPFQFNAVSNDYAPYTRIAIDGGPSQSIVNESCTPASNSWNYVCYPAHGILSVTSVKYVSSGTALTYITPSAYASGSSAGQYTYVDNILFFNSADNVPLNITYTAASDATSRRFLYVFEAQTHGTALSGATVVQSSSGVNFDGANANNTCVMFKKNISDTMGTTVYPASSCTTHYVTGLLPNTSYTLTGTGTPASATSDSAGVLTFAATGTGNISVAGSSCTTPPTASILTPSAGTVSGTVNVTASASATCGTVSSVQYTLSGSNLGGVQTTNPYTYSWNTTGTANGSYNLACVVADTYSNTGNCPNVSVTVSNGGGSTAGAGMYGQYVCLGKCVAQ